jgi:hypothetical protein
MESSIDILKAKLPAPLNNAQPFLQAITALLPHLEEFLTNHADLIFKHLPLQPGRQRHSLYQVLHEIPAIRFAKLSKLTHWAETAGLQISFNPKFTAWIQKTNQHPLQGTDHSRFLIALAIALMHELAHVFLRYGAISNTTIPLPEGRTPPNLLEDLLVVDKGDFGDAAELYIFKIPISADCIAVSLIAVQTGSAGFFSTMARSVSCLVLFHSLTISFENVHLGYNIGKELHGLKQTVYDSLLGGIYDVCLLYCMRRSISRFSVHAIGESVPTGI